MYLFSSKLLKQEFGKLYECYRIALKGQVTHETEYSATFVASNTEL